MRSLALSVLVSLPLAVWAQTNRTFDSPEQAAEAAIQAAERNDEAALSAIFGPGEKMVVSSGNPQQDQTERTQFAKLARSKHRIQKDPLSPNRVLLVIGSQDWPFPVPIVRRNGKWSFDASQGNLEMRARRIGADELDAMEICAGYVQAQQSYAARARDQHGMQEYAQHLSGPADSLFGQKDVAGLVPQPFVEADGSSPKSKPYHGYYFRILTSQGPNAPGGAHNYVVKGSMIGGFALVAYPAQYGVSGVHTFIVNQDGVVYERDLGPKGPRPASFDPAKGWKPVY